VLTNARAYRSPSVIDSHATRETSLDPRPRQQNFVEVNKKLVDGNTLFVDVEHNSGCANSDSVDDNKQPVGGSSGLLTATSDLLTATADLLTATSNVLTATPYLLTATPNVLASTKFC